MITSTDHLASTIGARLQSAGLIPDDAAICQLVQEHRERYIQRLLAQYRVQHASPTFIAHLRTIEDAATIDTLIRHHAAVQEKLRQEADAEVIA